LRIPPPDEEDEELWPPFPGCTVTEIGEEPDREEEEEADEEPELFGGLPCKGFDMFSAVPHLLRNYFLYFPSKLSQLLLARSLSLSLQFFLLLWLFRCP